MHKCEIGWQIFKRADDIRKFFMKLTVKTSMGDYNIEIKRGSINSLSDYCNTDKKALIITDSGVPFEYAPPYRPEGNTYALVAHSARGRRAA